MLNSGIIDLDSSVALMNPSLDFCPQTFSDATVTSLTHSLTACVCQGKFLIKSGISPDITNDWISSLDIFRSRGGEVNFATFQSMSSVNSAA